MTTEPTIPQSEQPFDKAQDMLLAGHPQDENQIFTERRSKLSAIRKAGIAFPNDFERKHLAGNLHAEFGAKTHDELEAAQIHVAVAGRMMLKRVMGKAELRHGAGYERKDPIVHQQ